MYVDKLDAAFVLGLLLVIGVTTFFILQTGPSVPHRCTAAVNLSDQLDCFAQDAANASDFATCADAPLPDACAGLYAYRHGTLDSCAAWPDVQGCQYFYHSARLQYDAVNSSQGHAACRLLSNATWRLSCLDRHAQYLKDTTFCHEMEFDHYRNLCLDQVSRTS